MIGDREGADTRVRPDMLPPLVVARRRAAVRRRERVVGVRLPRDLAVVLADVLVLDDGVSGERDGD